MYTALHTTIDLCGMLDLSEVRDVAASWRAAGRRNASHERKLAELSKGRR